jgi:ATP-dependent Clp protease protease subunit|nr:MAG TPA: Protease subunit of ATP-dependent Clp protease [Caudoviricetes sp.]
MIFLDIKGEIASERTKAMMSLLGGSRELCSVENIRKALSEHPEDKEVSIRIDCDGGSVSEGLKIYDELRNSGKTIYANVVGGCHSMAVCILLAAPKENRSANRNCRALIHRVLAPVCDYISADDALDIAESLVMEEDAILDIYEERTGTDRNTLREVMRKEQVHDAKSLQELGFISKINSYNTNQFFNKFSTMAEKPKQSAYEKFMSKLNIFRNGEPKNFDYKDAEGNVVLSTVGEEDNLAEGVEATLASGEASGVVTLEDGRIVTVTDNVVTDIEEAEETENLEERVAHLEELLDDATNLVQSQQETINELQNRLTEKDNELKNYKGSTYQPKNRKSQVPGLGKKNAAQPTAEVLKSQAKERRELYNQKSQIIKK